MSPEHLSLYLLEIHEGTPLAEQVQSGRRTAIDDELAAEMYELMIDALSDAGYQQYEISNFARSGHESRHNSKYWKLEPVYGFGVSAHSFDGVERYANERDTNAYVRLIESGASAEVHREPVDECIAVRGDKARVGSKWDRQPRRREAIAIEQHDRAVRTVAPIEGPYVRG